jgi:hypothetical protein
MTRYYRYGTSVGERRVYGKHEVPRNVGKFHWLLAHTVCRYIGVNVSAAIAATTRTKPRWPIPLHGDPAP